MQIRQLANTGRYNTCETVVCNVKLLNTLHVSNAGRERALKMIEAHVKNSYFLEHPDLGRQASSEIVVHENDLVQGFAHPSDAAWNAPTKVVVRKDKNRNRRVPKILWDAKLEPVVVQEDSIKRLVKELGGHRTFKLVEAQIQVLEGRQ